MSDAKPEPGSQEWLDLVEEPAIDPGRPIIDPHHHLWPHRWGPYLLEDLWQDTDSGHNIEATVFLECHTNYRETGPEHLRSVGETQWVAEIAEQSRIQNNGHQAEIRGIVGNADLRHDDLDEILEAHADAGDGLFRGIRHAGARDPHPEVLSIPGRAPEGLYADPNFRRGVARLGELGYSYDTWHYHHQNQDFLALARAVPDTPMVIDHFGTPLGVGPYAHERDAIFKAWKEDVAELAKCPNLYAKLGGLAMPDNGFGWDQQATPATSQQIVDAQSKYYHHMIECFGPERCMFESNFPVDRRSVSYGVLFNALKKMAAGFSEAEQHAMFFGVANEVYGLGVRVGGISAR